MGSTAHIPVLAEEVIQYLLPHPEQECRIIDGTEGFGGHSSLILNKAQKAQLIGIDRDETALAFAEERLSFAKDRVRLFHSEFSHLTDCVREAGWDQVDGILLDIGVSSPQLDNMDRGFSWKSSAPLDMRMDRSKGFTAADLLQTGTQEALTKIFRDYGGFREAGRLAREIVSAREKEPLERCDQFTAICDKVLGHAGRHGGGLPAPTLPYQALRIAVNDELGELERALNSAAGLLRPGGRLCVITFHSLEDRIVKHFFQDRAAECKCPPGCPVCICGWKPELRILTKKPVEAQKSEVETNSRSACAKLRVAERTEFELNNNN